jgi:hypothetical protein
MAGISDDVENLRVNRGDFMNALEEVHPAFGVSEEELLQVIQNGIIRFDKYVDVGLTFFKPYPCIHDFYHHRSSSGQVNFLLNKFVHQHVRLLSVFYCMVRPDPGKRPLGLRLHKLLSSLSLNWCLLMGWWGIRKIRRLLPFKKSSLTAIKVH